MDGPANKTQRFFQNRTEAENLANAQPITITNYNLRDYNTKLDDTLRALQDRVKRHEQDLQRLRAANSIDLSSINEDPRLRVAEVRRAKKAYDSLLKSETQFPKPGSPLPSLLAVDETTRLIRESKASVTLTAQKLSSDRQRLKAEEANLRDAQTIRDGLQQRIETIRAEKSRKQQKTPEDLARDHLKHQERKKEEIDRATEDLRTSLHKFVDDTLAAMLAAENLGGPTVGDVFEISDATLRAGYTNHGKPKKQKPEDTEGEDRSQRRIDEILNRQIGEGRSSSSNKREAAAAEMHELLDKLLDAGSSYIDLPRESAASRFLIRAKVAQFHPRDARRLRLIDFGRSLND